MAPYGGPNLAALLSLLQNGMKQTVALGFGIPKATLAFTDGMFELRALSGGDGFGVQADLVTPFKDEGPLVRTATWQEMFAWLCESWRDDWGAPLKKNEQLRIRFSGGDAHALALALRGELGLGLTDAMTHANDGITARSVKTAAAACRAARSAGSTVDFDAA
jgi:hypothetical protein